MLHITKTHIILYVSDQKTVISFYSQVLQREPILDVPGMTEFELSPACVLGLMPENGIAKIISPPMPHPASGSGIPRCELYLYVDNVEEACNTAQQHGAQIISLTALRNWGDTACYLSDPDGHVVAFAEKN